MALKRLASMCARQLAATCLSPRFQRLGPRCVVLVAALCSAVAVPSSLIADETPLPLGDLAQGLTEASGFSFIASTSDDRMLFWADDGRRGLELWITDGTPAGTRLWTEICPGQCRLEEERNSRFEDVVFNGERAFFIVDDGVHGRELWTADGSVDGTRLVADVCPGPCEAEIRELALIGDRAFFLATTAQSGDEPWVSDGTAEGTLPLGDFSPGPSGSQPYMFSPLGDEVAFLMSTPEHGLEWWGSDGTPAGTRRLTDLCSGPCSNYAVEALPFGNDILFVAVVDVDNPQLILYRLSPGQGATPLTTVCESDCGVSNGPLHEAAGRVYIARDEALWSTDGTAAGTRFELPLPASFFLVRALTALDDGTIVLLAWDKDGSHTFWRLDASTLTGPLVVGSSRMSLGNLGDQVVLVDAGRETVDLWSSDGTVPGTARYGQLPSTSSFGSFVQGPSVLGGQAVFSVFNRTDFRLGELLVSGGQGTTLQALWQVEDRPASTDPRDLTFAGSEVVYRDEGFHTVFDTLWAVDDFGQTQRLLVESEPEDLVAVELAAGPHVFFTAFEGPGDRVPYLTDGTLDGTVKLEDVADGGGLSWAREPVVFNGELFFLADQGRGQKLWRGGAMAGGAELVVDLRPDWLNIHEGCGVCSPPILPTPIFPRSLRVVGQGGGARLVFVGGQATSGAELWQSDGTAEGTSLLFDLLPIGDSEPEDLMAAGAGLVFTAEGGNGRRLWVWDGQSAPTELLASGEILATASSEGRAVWIESLDGTFRLWASDGTVSGTSPVATLPAGTVPEAVLISTRTHVFFPAANSLGTELWLSELTPGGPGPRPLVDLWPGGRGSFPKDLRLIAEQLYFSADDGVHGRELWRIDLRSEPFFPLLLGDIAPGSAPSSPNEPALMIPSRPEIPTGLIFYGANDGATGRELWVSSLPPDTPFCRPDATTLCLQDRRFRVTAVWRDAFNGTQGVGQVLPSIDESGYFWFFGPDNLELAVKVIDGREINNSHWFFYGALSDVGYDITVEDLVTGVVRTYSNEQGNFCGQGDIQAFPELPGSLPAATRSGDGSQGGGFRGSGQTLQMAPSLPDGELWRPDPTKIGACEASPTQLCLLGGRFEISVDWRDHDGNTGQGRVASTNGQTGLFWFFDSQNIELVVKAIDGTDFNNAYWIFYGALSDVEYTLSVVDTVTGEAVTYENRAGNLCGRGDTGAFPIIP